MEIPFIIFGLMIASVVLAFAGVYKAMITRIAFEAAVFFKGAATLYVIVTLVMGALACTYGGLHWVNLASCVAICFLLHKASITHLSRNGFTDDVIAEIKRPITHTRSANQVSSHEEDTGKIRSLDLDEAFEELDFAHDKAVGGIIYGDINNYPSH